MKNDDIRLTPISNGTVLDHLKVGSALKILELLKLGHQHAITLAINTESGKLGRKDLVFIEGKELSGEEINKIALIARGATLNIIKNSNVANKNKIELPKSVNGTIKCINPNCITNAESIATKFSISDAPLRAKCRYCEREMDESEIFNSVK
ncbi:MAG: aspartate carbamoyltransferase regulatory subunit [Candidatus Diapherotrites archaeon]|nr:aspartate carbamoyltransferase regulatory subunit [Candidatus Diapherotrites archaeon]